MSEFGQQYRFYGVGEAQIRALLDGMEGWRVDEIETYGERHPVFCQTKSDPQPTDIVRITADAEHEYTTLELWNLEMHESIVEALDAQKCTYLTYLYHTGAGFDELTVHVEGKLALTEDLGEVYQFTTKGACADLETEYGRDDEQGRTFVKADPPIREAELEKLTDAMGPSAVILHGWQGCVSEGLPLYYLPGLI